MSYHIYMASSFICAETMVIYSTCHFCGNVDR